MQPYFVLEGNVCALLAAKDHVNLFLYADHCQQPRRRLAQTQEAIGVSPRPFIVIETVPPGASEPRPVVDRPERVPALR